MNRNNYDFSNVLKYIIDENKQNIYYVAYKITNISISNLYNA